MTANAKQIFHNICFYVRRDDENCGVLLRLRNVILVFVDYKSGVCERQSQRVFFTLLAKAIKHPQLPIPMFPHYI